MAFLSARPFLKTPGSLTYQRMIDTYHLKKSPNMPPATAMPSITCSFSRRQFIKVLVPSTVFVGSGMLRPQVTQAARPEGVNRPDLLPNRFTTVIDLEHYLATGQVRRLCERIEDLERRTGFKIRLLTQRYPQTPGLAVRDYWKVDDDTVVIVADYFGGSGQLLKFNVGANVDRLLPPRFWSILSANYGNKFYVSKHSEAFSIINAVESIRTCLLNGGCAAPPRDLESVIF